ncbi:MAG: hypothetical protein HY533_00060, partial [Chloroflexi bacterium]|nr:hypothetical protein [Chloroflexota bacterium]
IVAGFVYDSTKSYRIAFLSIAVTYVVAAILYWTMRAPEVPKRAEEAPTVPTPAAVEQ